MENSMAHACVSESVKDRSPAGQKKGLSSVITTILIILITVAAIAIIWTSVLPMLKTSTSLSCTDVDLSIGTEGYTCYSPNNLTAVHVKKGPNSVNVTGVTISLSSLGNTVSYSTDYNFQPNTQKTFYLNSSSLNSIDKIGLVAIYSKDKTKLECPSVYMENARTKTCDLSSVRIYHGHGNWVASDNILVQQDGVCIPDCSDASNYFVNQNFSDGCGGNCRGVLDVIYPQFLNYQDNTGDVENSGTGLFDVTVLNINGTVILNINGTNVTATNTTYGGDIYNASYSFSTPGTYSYQWYVFGNGSYNNLNVSATRNYVVASCRVPVPRQCMPGYHLVSNPFIMENGCTNQNSSCVLNEGGKG